MSLIAINKNPSPNDLKWFGLVLALFFGVLGGVIWWRFGQVSVARGLWIAGAALATVYYALPPVRRAMFVGWMYLAYPIGWTISHVILALTYYVVLTPIGLIMRMFGRDPMHRRLDPQAETYWVQRPAATDSKRYFRQF